MRTVIISGGAIDDTFAMRFLMEQPFDYLIVADKGLEFVYRCHLKPDCIVGDYDSVSADILETFRADASIEIRTFQPEKDYTDTDIAIQIACEKGSSEIYLLGATGTRIDHMLANIHCMVLPLKKGIACSMLDAHNRIRLTDGSMVLYKESQYGENVSLIPLTGEVSGVTLQGFQYPLDDYTFQTGVSIGISNVIVEKEAHISCREGILIVIESKD